MLCWAAMPLASTSHESGGPPPVHPSGRGTRIGREVSPVGGWNDVSEVAPVVVGWESKVSCKLGCRVARVGGLLCLL